MLHGEEQPDQTSTSFEIIDAPRNDGEPTQATVPADDSVTREEKERTFERVDREMEIFRKGEYSRFQASTRVANELEKWVGASDQEKGKALDSYLAEINSFIAIQNEDQSVTRGTPPPIGALLPAER